MTGENDRTDAILNTVVGHIASYGWGVQHVFADPDATPPEPAFSYTSGLFIKDCPEFIVFNLGPVIAQAILNDLAQRAAGGVRFKHGQVLDDVVEDFPVVLLAVQNSRSHLTIANNLAVTLTEFDPRPIPAWQVVFPDSSGLWPWDMGSRVAAMPVLGDTPTIG